MPVTGGDCDGSWTGKREFARNSALGRDPKVALERFEAACADGVDRNTLMDRVSAVDAVTQTIWAECWRQVERRHGQIGHIFDGFGQITPQCRVDASVAQAVRTSAASEVRIRMQQNW